MGSVADEYRAMYKMPTAEADPSVGGSVADEYRAMFKMDAPKAEPAPEVDYGFGTEPADPYTPTEPSMLKKAANVAGGVNSAIIGTANLPFVAANFLGELAGGDPANSKTLFDIPHMGRSLEDLTKPVIPKDRAGASGMLRTAAEWGAGGPLKMGSNLARKAPVLADTALDALMGTSAMIGSEIAGTKGEIGGGILGMIASLLRGKAPSNLQQLKEAVPFSAARSEAKTGEKAAKLIEENLSNETTARAIAAGKVGEGEIGTILDLTEDAAFAGANKGLTPAGNRQIQEVTKARNQQIVDDINAPFGTESATLARQTAGDITQDTQASIAEAYATRMQHTKSTAEGGLAQARAAAEQAAQDVQSAGGE
jgi:hypothetical protein